jgi:hypothetical protein
MKKIVTRVLMITYEEDTVYDSATMLKVEEQRPKGVVELPIEFYATDQRGVTVFLNPTTGNMISIMEDK